MTTILFGKESACTEDPGGYDRRTVLVPADVRAYLAAGFEVVVQSGLGDGIGYLDNQYEMEGARVEAGPDCYAGKEIVVKLKGAEAAEIACMSPNTVMLTMAHLYCFPERTAQLAARQTAVIAMEGVQKPAAPADAYLDGIRAGARVEVSALGADPHIHVAQSADQDYLNGLLRALMRRTGGPLHVNYLETQAGSRTTPEATSNLAVTASGIFLRDKDGALHDISSTPATEREQTMVQEELNRSTRAVGQTREVGIGALRYSLGLYRTLHGAATPRVAVLGYGNVSMGAFEQLRTAAVPFTILGRAQTAPEALPSWLERTDLAVNGAETPGSDDFIITNQQVDDHLGEGSVIVDLIGGSPFRRSPVERFEWTTFMPDIHFEKDGRYYTGLWAWDMYYSMHDTTVNYSRMIKDVLASGRYVSDPHLFVADHAYAQQLGG